MEFEKAWETLDKVEPTHMDMLKWSSPRVIGLVGSSQTGFNIFIFIQQTMFYTHTHIIQKNDTYIPYKHIGFFLNLLKIWAVPAQLRRWVSSLSGEIAHRS
jgi:hypothetical protein